jgi:mannose/cellobiose epimerase-like protein (N-acyl-D-glucosamine 2-epimerase family)
LLRGGGFYHFFRDDGSVYDLHTRHLVSSTRFVFNYAMAHRHFGGPDYLPMVRHGLAFLRDVHRNPATGGYAWLLRRNDGGDRGAGRHQPLLRPGLRAAGLCAR